jgi:copper chaperone
MTEFQIDDMTCSHCASTIARAVHSLDPAANRVRVESPVGPYKLVAAIRGAGCTPAGA